MMAGCSIQQTLAAEGVTLPSSSGPSPRVPATGSARRCARGTARGRSRRTSSIWRLRAPWSSSRAAAAAYTRRTWADRAPRHGILRDVEGLHAQGERLHVLAHREERVCADRRSRSVGGCRNARRSAGIRIGPDEHGVARRLRKWPYEELRPGACALEAALGPFSRLEPLVATESPPSSPSPRSPRGPRACSASWRRLVRARPDRRPRTQVAPEKIDGGLFRSPAEKRWLAHTKHGGCPRRDRTRG